MEFEYEPGRFYKNNTEGQLMAEVTFTDFADGAAYSINHTFVSNELRGQGIASQLVKLVVDKAIAEDKKILPLCSYAKAQFEKKPEYQAIEYKG